MSFTPLGVENKARAKNWFPRGVHGVGRGNMTKPWHLDNESIVLVFKNGLKSPTTAEVRQLKNHPKMSEMGGSGQNMSLGFRFRRMGFYII